MRYHHCVPHGAGCMGCVRFTETKQGVFETMNRQIDRQERIVATLQRWNPEAKDEYLERQILEEVIRHGYMGMIAPLTAIADYLKQKAQPEIYKCGCGREFETPNALSGHKRTCKV